jgi:hypothetical protein
MNSPFEAEFDSTAVERSRYDPHRGVFDLWYAGGDRYSYFKVPKEVGAERGLSGAASVGRKRRGRRRFVNLRIKPHYQHELEARRRRFRPPGGED